MFWGFFHQAFFLHQKFFCNAVCVFYFYFFTQSLMLFQQLQLLLCLLMLLCLLFLLKYSWSDNKLLLSSKMKLLKISNVFWYFSNSLTQKDFHFYKCKYWICLEQDNSKMFQHSIYHFYHQLFAPVKMN